MATNLWRGGRVLPTQQQRCCLSTFPSSRQTASSIDFASPRSRELSSPSSLPQVRCRGAFISLPFFIVEVECLSRCESDWMRKCSQGSTQKRDCENGFGGN